MIELKLKWDNDNNFIKLEKLENGLIGIEVFHPDYCEETVPTLINRGQAHLLMLYLQEHMEELK